MHRGIAGREGGMSGIEVTDKQAEAVAVAPRVRLSDIEGGIAERYDFTADKAIEDAPNQSRLAYGALRLLSICILVMRNGFVVIGKSAPASPENFNADLGKQFAYEDAVRQLWPLMGYALREKLANG